GRQAEDQLLVDAGSQGEHHAAGDAMSSGVQWKKLADDAAEGQQRDGQQGGLDVQSHGRSKMDLPAVVTGDVPAYQHANDHQRREISAGGAEHFQELADQIEGQDT